MIPHLQSVTGKDLSRLRKLTKPLQTLNCHGGTLRFTVSHHLVEKVYAAK
jgi:hypothetical protein